MSPSAPRPATRSEPREVVELKLLRAQQPELGTAIDLQLGQLDLFRRAQSRASLPATLDPARVAAAIATGRPIARFTDIPLNWSDYRWILRETVDLLRRFDLIDPAVHAKVHHLMRDGHTLEPAVAAWFAAALEGRTHDESAEFGEVFGRALKPFIARCAEAWLPRIDLAGWTRGVCPLCGGGPELGVIGGDGDRRLVCERCSGRWDCAPEHCPWCGEDRAAQRTTLTTPDGRYRLDACESCRRYVKSCDERYLGRPAIPWVDAVATMPLDAAALQRGYEG